MGMPPPAPLLREVTREVSPDENLSLQQQREAAANENDGESDFAWPRPQFCGSGPSPNVNCSSRRGSQCQYLATSEIPTQLLNLVLPDSDDEDIVVDVEEKSKRNSV